MQALCMNTHIQMHTNTNRHAWLWSIYVTKSMTSLVADVKVNVYLGSAIPKGIMVSAQTYYKHSMQEKFIFFKLKISN
jgi:hypothetical protein